LKLYKAH